MEAQQMSIRHTMARIEATRLFYRTARKGRLSNGAHDGRHAQMATRAKKIGTKRPQTIDQPPLPPDLLAIASELQSDLGLELFMLAHQLFLTAYEAQGNGSLFHSVPSKHVSIRRRAALTEAPGDLLADLRVLISAVSDSSSPPKIAEVASACGFVSEWARNAGHPLTAIVYAEAAATIAPNNSEAAFIAGRANRLAGQHWRAEVFYRRAIRLAYRTLNHDVRIRATLGLGRLMAETGRANIAEQYYASAASVAETQGLEWLAAQTYHDMLVLHFDGGDLEKALAYARQALRIYPTHNERFPIAVHDLAFVLIAGQHFKDALPILEAVFNAPLDPQEQVLVAGTMARIAGNLGLEDQLMKAEGRLLYFAPNHPHHAAFAIWNLAHGMHALGEWERAERYARRALLIADETDVDYVRTHARALLEELRARTPPLPPSPYPLNRELAEELQMLTARVSTWHNDPSWSKRWAGQRPKKLGAV
jgi:tetratricopeptide (TPR) repeat protein